MTRFTMPVSSSRVEKTTPLAEPGRWRMRTSPAVRKGWRSRASSMAPQLCQPSRASSGRRTAQGCAFKESRSQA